MEIFNEKNGVPLLGEGARRKGGVVKDGAGKQEALCWQCRRATGGCEWSAFLQPVPGWQAERTFPPGKAGGAVQLAPGIRVAACPKFERTEGSGGKAADDGKNRHRQHWSIGTEPGWRQSG